MEYIIGIVEEHSLVRGRKLEGNPAKDPGTENDGVESRDSRWTADVE